MRWWVLLLSSGCIAGTASPDAGPLSIPTATDLAEPRNVLSHPDDAGPTDGATILDLGVAGSADLAPPLDLAPDLKKPSRPSPIAVENQLPGGSGWKLTAPSNGVAGFADHQSYFPGDSVAIHAAAPSATTVTWELWRLGYYGGAGGRRITSGGPVAIPHAAAAIMNSSTGMVSAPWATSFTLALPADAVTGFYVVKLIAASTQSSVPFVVKEPTPSAAVVWPVAFNTYQAYNAWGGTGLYNNTRSDWKPWHAYEVSFDRPYLQGGGAGQLFFADRHFITFVEGQGYDLDYVGDCDVAADAAQVSGRALIVLEGHAEYWSASARANLVAAVGAGTNLVVLGANDLFWQVRYDGRNMIGYKEFANLDPIGVPSLVTTEWRNLGLPENALLGVQFGEWIWSSVPLRVSDPTSWIWDGARVDEGALIAGLYGFEIDRRYDNGAEPAGVGEIGRGLGENHAATLAMGQATMYTAPSGATVFASGTVSWSQALAAPGMWDARVQQATHNLISRLGGVGQAGVAPKTLVLPAGPPQPDYVPGVEVTTITSALSTPAALALAPDGTAIVADGNNLVRVDSAGHVSAIAAGFAGPRGVAVGSDGTIYVSDTGNHQIKKISGGVVTLLAGSTEGFSDGKPGQLDQPMSIALLPSGTLLVADSWNQRVRAVAPDGTLSTWAGNGAEASIDGVGSAASIYFPFALATFPDGTTAVAESNDGVVRRIAANQSVSTFIGELGRTGWWDGPADSAAVSELAGVAARADGALVLLDAASYRVRILSNGEARTLAGGATSELTDGAGSDAGFLLPRAGAFAADGSLWIADAGNHALRRITIP